MAAPDYYATLGVKKDASSDEIKRAYRRLAREHHPDLHAHSGKKEAEAKFKEINEAYQVLSDPEKRAKYDDVGPGWEAPPPPPRRRRGPEPEDVESAGAEQFSGFSDFFEDLFGDAGRHGFGVGDASGRARGRGQDVEAELPLSLEDAFNGGEKRMTIQAPVLCPACGGSGRRERAFCPACGGVGEARREKTITVHLPKHVRDGTKLRLRGQGGEGRAGQGPGDLFLRVRLLAHPGYKVSGSDLETAVTVMPWVAALGGVAEVPSLEGAIRIRIPPQTHAGRPFRVPGKGLAKDGGGRGDLYAVVRIDNPDRLDARIEELYRRMKEGA